MLVVGSCAQIQKILPPEKDGSVASATTDEMNNKAALAFKSGNYEQSAALYEKFLVQSPLDQKGIFYYAESLRISGQTEKSIEQYNKLGTENLSALEGKGLAYLQIGELESSLDQFNLVLKKDASRWRTVNAIGVINSIIGKNEEAMQYYKIALELSKNNPSIINNIALGVAFGGNPEQGIAMLKTALDSSTDGEIKKQRLENNLALLYGISGKMNDAEKILRKNLPEAAVYNNLGFYAKLRSDKKLAWNYLSKAISASPVYYEKAGNNMQSLEEELKLPSFGYKNFPAHENTEQTTKTLKVRRGTKKLPLPSIK